MTHPKHLKCVKESPCSLSNSESIDLWYSWKGLVPYRWLFGDLIEDILFFVKCDFFTPFLVIL